MSFLDNYFSPLTYQGGGILGRFPDLLAMPGQTQGFPGAPNVLPQNSAPAVGQVAASGAPVPADSLPVTGQAQDATPGLLDRLTAGASNFMTGGNPIAGLLNSISGLATGQRTDAMGMQLQQQDATRRALVSAGVPMPIAAAAALNPKILESIAPRYLGENFKVVPYGATAINQKGDVIYQNDQGAASLLDDTTIDAMARQYRAGDTTVMQNLGRGIQGAQNIVKLRAAIARQNAGEGVSGEEQAMKNAEFFGVKSGQRTLGNRQANIELASTELKQVIPVVMEASNAVDRTNYPSLNAIIQKWQEGTGDPNIVRFASGINTLINLYARAINPTGVPTVEDKRNAREVLNKAWASGQFNAAVAMMQREVEAGLTAPGMVKQDMRDRFLGTQAPAPAAASPAPSAPAAPAIPPMPPTLPAGSQYSPSRNQWRDPAGRLYDASGKPI